MLSHRCDAVASHPAQSIPRDALRCRASIVASVNGTACIASLGSTTARQASSKSIGCLMRQRSISHKKIFFFSCRTCGAPGCKASRGLMRQGAVASKPRIAYALTASMMLLPVAFKCNRQHRDRREEKIFLPCNYALIVKQEQPRAKRTSPPDKTAMRRLAKHPACDASIVAALEGMGMIRQAFLSERR